MPGNANNRSNAKLTLAQRRAAIARASRSQDGEAVAAERREYAAARLEDYISRVVASAPPLTEEQIGRLAPLLRGRVGGLDGAA